jgi:hypothetical protein
MGGDKARVPARERPVIRFLSFSVIVELTFAFGRELFRGFRGPLGGRILVRVARFIEADVDKALIGTGLKPVPVLALWSARLDVAGVYTSDPCENGVYGTKPSRGALRI